MVVAPLLALLIAGVAAACGGGENDPSDAASDPTQSQQAPTAAPTQPPAQPTAQPTATSPAVSDDARIAVAALAAIDVVDSAGFHDMAKTLAEATEINPRLARTVANVRTVVEGTRWGSALESQAHELAEALAVLEAALTAEDLDGARAAAEAVHDAQHDLSADTYAWLASVGPVDPADRDAAIVSLIAAIDIIDSAGFHDMAKALAEADEINPRFAGTTAKAVTAARVAAWSPDLAAEGSKLTSDLEDLLAALESGDVAAAAAAAEAVHDSQHDASKATYAWLAEHHASMSHDDPTLAYACAVKVVDAIDGVGFHDMARELAEATEINPRYAGRVANALAVMHREAMEDAAAFDHLRETMQSLYDALVAGDLDAARELSETVHEAQHDFSGAMYGQMAAMHGSH
ncbi:MAG: hypothetical protein Kow0010_07930 [Dehalococcoidia bacterium]